MSPSTRSLATRRGRQTTGSLIQRKQPALPSSAKRRKKDHTPDEPSSPRSKITSRSDDRIAETPVDVLYEIFSYLGPLDLLHLSWSSKAFHSIVLGKSARFIWENAFEELYANAPLRGYTRCPPDLNLVQYTKLLFNDNCMECGSLQDTRIVWILRSCFCSKCLQGKRFSTLTDRQYRALLPCVFVNGKQRPYVRASELNEVKAMLDSLKPGSRRWTEYVKQREKRVNTLQQGEKEFLYWRREYQYDKSEKLKDLRQNMIVQRLGELGWKDEIDRLSKDELRAFPGIGTTKPLTDKGWKILCPRLITHLENIQVLRLERERQDRIVERCQTLSTKISSWAIKQSSPENMLPRVLDVAFKEPFRSFIFHDSDTEPTFIANEDELERVMEQITEEWNEIRTEFLLSLIPASTGPDGKETNGKGKGKATPLSALKLATTIFHCPSGGMSCPSGMDNTSYPRILAHECQRPGATKRSCPDTDLEGLEGFEVLLNGLFSSPWLYHCEELTFDQQASDAAKIVIQACGENPDEITGKRMDEIDCRLQCMRCRGSERERYIVNWRKAIRHEVVHFRHPATSPPGKVKWHLVTDPQDLALVYAAEKTAKIGTPKIECKACGTRFWNIGVKSDLELMQTHWRSCVRCYISTQLDPDGRLLPSYEPNPSVPEEKILRALFKAGREWFISDLDVLIPPREDEDDEMESSS